MANLSESERLNLKQLVNEMDCDNNTENIRKLKHSVLIRDDIRKLENLKKSNETLSKTGLFIEMCQEQCKFLYNNYTDIFHKVIKDELDLQIMTKLLIILKLIEDGKVDQHEGSVMVGKYLKELYVDSAVRCADNLDKEHEAEKVQINEGSNISWKDFVKSQYIETLYKK